MDEITELRNKLAAAESRLREAEKDLALLLRTLGGVDLPREICETLGAINLRLRKRVSP